ncbi:hypothetical protein VTN77DRAFT_2647 [Rasamsonia byssochlamydoides]|uniref:uncharacterized protein n=1 Tax=Rasamsonia byssochlamydoides TaxID=89139 RepID=UPI0037440BDA
MPSRRSHQNSHHGCKQCKQARKKCDEGQPSCRRCRDRNLQCTYHHLQSSYNPFVQYDARPSSPRPSLKRPSLEVESPAACLSNPSDDYGEMFLAHHYFTVISKSIQNTPKEENFRHWDSAIRCHYSSCPFIQYGVCALASLHLAMLYPHSRASHLATAMKCQNMGISKFQPVLSNISSGDLEACLTFAGILTICAYASSRAATETETITDALHGLRQVMSLSQGVKLLYQMNNKSHQIDQDQDTLNKHIRQKIQQARTHEVDWIPEGQISLDQLSEYVLTSSLEDENLRSMYLSTISKLKTTMRCDAAKPGVASFVNLFSATVAPEFLTELDRRRPLALIIAAHYAVCLHGIRRYWWMKGWGKSVVQAVAKELDPHWLKFLEWPMQQTCVELFSDMTMNMEIMPAETLPCRC